MKEWIIALSIAAVAVAAVVYPIYRTETRPVWRVEYNPQTDAERQQVADHAQKILAATPASLAGNDQDWDTAIYQAHKEAKNLFCKPRLYEYLGYVKTGRFKELE